MKGIHAISTILAVWRINSAAPAAPGHPARPARASELHAKSSHGDSTSTPSSCVNSRQPHVGIPSLLGAALLQGGSSTERRRN